MNISAVALIVSDYNESIAYFTEKLDFQLVEDTPLEKEKRWVLVAPKGAPGNSLLLAKAINEDQASRIGNQSGGRVFLFLHTDDFHRDYEKMLSKGVEFIEKPRSESYGTVVVFKDLYGNKWDLIEPNNKALPLE